MGNTASSHDQQFDKYIQTNKPEELKKLGLQNNTTPIGPEFESFIEDREEETNASSKQHFSLLHVAASRGDMNTVRQLLHTYSDANSLDFDGSPPLHYATAFGHKEVVELLIAKGAELEAKNAPWNQTPLHLACKKGHINITKLLLDKGADINSTDFYSYTPLNLASYYGFTDVVQFLLSRGADPNTVNNNGESPLLSAAQKGYTEIARILIENGANVNESEKDKNWTALHFSAKQGNGALICLLLEREANSNKKDKNGQTAIEVAVREGQGVKLMRELKEVHDHSPKNANLSRLYNLLAQHTSNNSSSSTSFNSKNCIF